MKIDYFRKYRLDEDGTKRPQSKNNDITIFVLKTAFDYTDFVRPAALPIPSFKAESGAKCIISGFGVRADSCESETDILVIWG
jgi:hypothetical protein